MILTDRQISRSEFEKGTGWRLTPEGACKGDVCVPFLESAVATGDGPIDVAEVAGPIGLPLVEDEARGVWALGPESIGSRALVTAAAADFELPDLDGSPFRLSSLRGRKVLVYAWAPY